MKLIKKWLFRSYTRSYYYRKLDEIETRYMKTSVHNEFKAMVHYVPSLASLKFYTSLADILINTLLVILITAFILLILGVMLLFWNLLNDFNAYY